MRPAAHPIESKTLQVETVGGQLSRTTDWTVKDGDTAICTIERSNWKLRWWTYRATFQLAEGTYEATSDASNGALVLSVRDPNTMVIATATDRTTMTYRDGSFQLTGIESPDSVRDANGEQLMSLHWRLQRLDHIDMHVPLTAEFVAVVTTFCVLHEHPTD